MSSTQYEWNAHLFNSALVNNLREPLLYKWDQIKFENPIYRMGRYAQRITVTSEDKAQETSEGS